ncbi:MAG: AAA family ATPase [Sulfurimonas sp.]|nr:AAA family ATPase [Sulfurimonas sp.]MDQ7060481.1 AAA family ATPase [Sulfurimonas sp.]
MNIDYFLKKQELLVSKTSIKYIREEYFGLMNAEERLVGLIGARGVGKTTLLFQYIKSCSAKALYMSGDDVEFTNSKIYDLVDEFYSLGGRIVVIDEVHKYKNWAQEVKNIYDSFPDLRIRLSGSSMLNILYEKYDLSRRLVLHTMSTLSFKEYLEITKDIKLQAYTFEEILSNSSAISKELVFANEDLYSHFKDYLRRGAYPFYLEGIAGFEQKLYNAMDKIIHEDIPSLNKIDYSHISIFEKFIYFVVSANKPFLINIASLAKELGVSAPTLTSYIDILENTSIFKAMRKKSTRMSKKPQKLLFSNTNILYAYANKIDLDLDIGTIRETYFVNCFENCYYSDIGDFVVNDIIFEVGGKNKSFTQVRDLENSYLAIDIDFSTNDKKIPLWLFSFIKEKA